MPGICLGVKFHIHVFFSGLQDEALSDPPVMYTTSLPPPPLPGWQASHAEGVAVLQT